jgi:germination protein M
VRRALLLVAVLVVAGCGSSKGAVTVTTTVTTGTSTTATTTTAPEKQQSVLLYFLDPSDQKLYALRQEIEPTQAVGAAALRALTQNPDTEVPPNLSLTIANGKAHVSGSTLSPGAEAQVVYTLTQFPTVKSVDGKTRKDVEDFVPAILVERPTADQVVTSPLRVTGNANTFEATFECDLRDGSGRLLHHEVVTATSGSGTRGTFDFTVPFTVTRESDGTLVVYERSAADGSIIHEREIPLRLRPASSP